ncbi:heparinase II/III family protein [Mucilaginibacter sp. PAMB04168]|uniref:heparinase II/III domain-containing protein n=1 Tax=Mucilaginibacter sp. PAMB04168 TaxID=3138567 RepID=UPI0031F6150E
MNYFKKVVSLLSCLCFSVCAVAQTHPNIMLTKANIAAVRKGVTLYPLLKSSYQDAKKEADRALAAPVVVPVPKDGGGGASHEQHKRNYQNIMACGIAYQITGDAKYATYVKNVLLQYAAQYQKWPLHPKRENSNPPGRMFWQILNDCVWQVNVIQGYDMVYNGITPADRKIIETQLFAPIVKFIYDDNKETFDRLHNHGTWAVAAVGLTGYVLNKPEWVQMALKGTDKSGQSGFLAQVDELFSPDGYYTEGFYYQRYALLPFVVFAKAINQYEPQRHIFQYHSGILTKAVNIALQGTYSNGAFFPINDAMKDKTFESSELINAVDIAYADISPDKGLLDVAARQKRVVVSDAGLKVAKDLAAGLAKPFNYQPMWMTDGKKGDEGGIGILRCGEGNKQQAVLLKAAAQGMGHGHFDRLNMLYYDNGGEVFPDYGASRFINIETKNGGGYLPENTSWAKQTVAHNALVVDQLSHFKGNLKEASKYHPELVAFKITDKIQVVSAREDHAYPGVQMVRAMALMQVPGLTKPLLVDVVKATAAANHQYDLPYWYKGTIVDASFKKEAIRDDLKALGKSNGYQHLWLNSENEVPAAEGYVSVMQGQSFYTTCFAGTAPMKVKLVSTGANDPDMSILESKAFMLSQPQAANQTFVTLTENHGQIDPVAETTSGAKSAIGKLNIISSNDSKTIFTFEVKHKAYTVTLNYQDKNNFIQVN